MSGFLKFVERFCSKETSRDYAAYCAMAKTVEKDIFGFLVNLKKIKMIY